MTTRNRIAALSTMAALATGAALAPGASATTATMGSALALPYEGGVCNNNCLSLQQAQVGGTGPLPIISPANGVVTGWAVRTSDDDAVYTLRILRPVGTNTYLGAGASAAQAPVPVGTTDQIINYTAPSIPIKEGDSIGLFQTGNADDGLPQNTTDGVTPNVIANNFGGQPAVDGGTAPFIPDGQHELLLQATVKYCNVPSLKGKKTKAAKQALVAADCAPRIVRKEVGKKKFRGKVLKQKPAAGETAPPGTQIKIVIGKKAK